MKGKSLALGRLAAAFLSLMPALALQARSAGVIEDEYKNKPPASASGPGSGEAKRVDIDQLQPAWGKPVIPPGPGQTTAGIKIWVYDPVKTEVINIRSADKTAIVWPEWEELSYVSWGDREVLTAQPPTDEKGRPIPGIRNAIEVFPNNGVERADTTLTIWGKVVAGKRNIYSARIRSFPIKAIDDGNKEIVTDNTVWVRAAPPGGNSIYLGEWEKRNEAVAMSDRGAMGKAAPDYLRSIPFDMSKLNFSDYEIQVPDGDSESIAPVRVFHDGVFTIIDFGEGGRADLVLRPVVSRVVDGVDNRINTRTTGPEGNLLVVEGVGYNLTLRNGRRVVCLTYKGVVLAPARSVGGQ